ncbi:MAG: AsmA family protein [Betaproteobacteria bacterium]|nr:AsmA family protein [Betaproteobacteria bacterium]
MALRAGTRWAGALLAALIALVVAVYLDPNLLRRPAAALLSAELGRRVAIGGNFGFTLSMTPTFRAGKVTVANASWGSQPNMADFRRVTVRVSLRNLVKGRLVLPRLDLVGPKVLLEKNAAGAPNWVFPGKPARMPKIGLLTIERGSLQYRDPRARTAVTLDAHTLPLAPGQAEPSLAVNGRGHFRGAPFSLHGRAGSILSLRSPTRPYPLAVAARIGGTQAQLHGTLTNPMRLAGVNVELALRGDNLASLYEIIGLPAPSVPPYRLSGHLTRRASLWSFRPFQGTVGRSDLSGWLSVDTAGARPVIRGKLLSHDLDYRDLAGFIGAPTEPGAHHRGPRVFPRQRFSVRRLRAADANVTFRGAHIVTRDLPLDDLTTHLILKNGYLTLTPLDLGVAGGHIASTIAVDGRQHPLAVSVASTLRGIQLRRLFPRFKLTRKSAGEFGGEAHITTRGNSFAEMAGHANGHVGIAASKGQISALLVALGQLHGWQALIAYLEGDKKEPIDCAVADLSIRNGRVSTKAFGIDTPDADFLLNGHIDMRDERLALVLRALPKHIGIISFRSPVRIGGDFKHPTFSLSTRSILARGAASIALGALVTPVAALAPLIDINETKGLHFCRRWIPKVEKGVVSQASGNLGYN